MSLGQTLLISEKEINEFIDNFIDQVMKAIGVMIKRNNYIIENNSSVSFQTRCICEVFRTSCIEYLSQTIMSFMFADTNMESVSNVFHYLFDDEPKHQSFEECCTFNSIGKVFYIEITPRISILL